MYIYDNVCIFLRKDSVAYTMQSHFVVHMAQSSHFAAMVQGKSSRTEGLLRLSRALGEAWVDFHFI